MNLRTRWHGRRRKTFSKTMATSQARTASPVLDATAGARVISAAILFLIAVAAIGLTVNDTFYISNPAVTGNQRVPADEIVVASEMEALHILWLQPDRTSSSLSAKMPELRAAFVWCGLPANCAIQVVERQPAFEWRQGQARTWVDAEGVAFPARGQAPDMQVVQVASGVAAPLPGQKVDAKLVGTMLALAKALPEVKSYRHTAERGVEFSDPRSNGPVYVGVGQDMAERVEIWKALSANLASRDIHPTFIDVHYPTAPFYGK